MEMLDNGEVSANTAVAPEPATIQSSHDDDTPLIVTIRASNVAKVEKLLLSGCDPNMLSGRGVTPISAAARTGNLEVTQLLLDYGADIDAVSTSGTTALIQVFQYI